MDQLPLQLVSLLMFGHAMLIPLPDLDRTDFLIIFGANPVVSNGSLMTAPGIPKRLKAIRKRDGKIVVVDPRKTETAALANQHIFIKPGSDALMVLAMLHVVFEQELQTLGSVGSFTKGLETIESLVKDYPPEKVSTITGVDAEQIRTLVKQFCSAKSASCYGRIGVSTHEYGTITQWLIMVFNVVTGNLDFPGGAMFSKPAFDILGTPPKKSSGSSSKKRKGFADFFTRVRKLPSFNGELPVAALAEEITTEGKDQIRALVTNAGNPVLSTANGRQLDAAIENLDYMVSIDLFINETTRHANIILPPLSALERPHYDLVFHTLAIHNTAKFSPGVFKPSKQQRSDAQIFLELSWRMQSINLISKMKGWIKKEFMLWYGSSSIVNLKLKKGPYAESHNMSLKLLKEHPHGVDLGAMQPCLPNRLFTNDKMINLAPEECIADLKRLNKNLLTENASLVTEEFNLQLIGRRDPRTNNSWLHNSYRMVKGKKRCLALIHPEDAASRNIEDGEQVLVKSRVGELTIAVSFSEEMMPGVVSIPHGWGHDMKGVELKIAKQHAGVNTNLLTDEYFIDELSGNTALNGVPISISKISSTVTEKV